MKKIIFIIITFSLSLFSQNGEADIVPHLKKIENGEIESVKKELTQLKSNFPNSSSVLFLEGVLTENGQEAVAIFKNLIDKYPTGKYADAAVYRIYSYYFALGFYDAAKNYLNRLKKFYPESPYIKIAEREIPNKNQEITASKIEEEKIKEEKESTGIKPTTRYNTAQQPVEKNYQYSIQAGAFSNEDNAKLLKKDFDNSGFYSSLKQKTVGGTVFNVVTVGRFETEEEARSFLQVINAEFKLDGRIIPYTE